MCENDIENNMKVHIGTDVEYTLSLLRQTTSYDVEKIEDHILVTLEAVSNRLRLWYNKDTGIITHISYG